MKNEQKRTGKRLVAGLLSMMMAALCLCMLFAWLTSAEIMPETTTMFFVKIGNAAAIFLISLLMVRKIDKNKMQWSLSVVCVYMGMSVLFCMVTMPQAKVEIDLWMAIYAAAAAVAAMIAVMKRQRKR